MAQGIEGVVVVKDFDTFKRSHLRFLLKTLQRKSD